MSDTATTADVPWYRMLNKYHWFVFAMSTMAWVFDCLDQQLFILARGDAMKALLPPGSDYNKYGGIATSIFVLGWATGGLIFGSLGDRFGRARMLTITVLLYSVCTGLSAFSADFTQFAIYRFITGLGVGGVFGLAVALVADTLPDAARSKALGTLQALSAVGNITSGYISVMIGKMGENKVIAAADSWKYMFMVGALPAFLCVFIAWRMKEPEKWMKARAEGKLSGVKLGSYSSLFGDARWRRHALAGMLLCIAGIIGVWGIGFFAPELVGGVIENSIRAELKGSGMDETAIVAKVSAETARWKGYNGIIQNIGAFLGMLSFTWVAQKLGRKRAFVIGTFCAMAATIFYFRCFNGKSDVWMSGVMGFFQLALFAGFAIYLPELFPTRLRSTGTSFCYNVGRYLAATGPVTMGYLQEHLKKGAIDAEAKLGAFRDACCWLSGIYLIGLIALPFLPETKGHPLPEDGQPEPAK